MNNQSGKFHFENGGMFFPQPFKLDGSLMSSFVFKSDFKSLQTVCDKWLNLPSNNNVYYTPILPNVMVTFSKNKTCNPSNPPYSDWGTIPYHEVIFSIFVIRIKKVGNVWVTEKLSAFVPYIFVNDAIIMAAGREIYGMPKIYSEIQLPNDPSVTGAVFSLESVSTPKFENGLPFNNMLIASIEQTSTESPSLSTDWKDLVTAVEAIKKLIFDSGHIELPGLNLILEVADFLLEKKISFASLRQVRSISSPNEAIYKAIIEFCCQSDKFNGGGLLHGTYKINLPENMLFPFASDFGIKNGQVAEAAFWIDWDFTFLNGEEVWSTGMKEKTSFLNRLSQLFKF